MARQSWGLVRDQMENVIVPEEVVQYLIGQTDGSVIQHEQVASLLRQRVMAATATAAPVGLGVPVPVPQPSQPHAYKPPPPPANQVARDLAFRPHMAAANALGPRPMSMTATVGTATSTVVPSASAASAYHWPLHPAAVEPSYVRDQFHPASTVPTPTQPLAYASPSAARWQRPNTRQVHCQRCGGIGHVARQQSVSGKPTLVDAAPASIYDSALQVATTAGRKEPLLDIRIGATTFQALLDSGSSTCKDCVAEAATVRPRDGATVGAVIIIMRMDSGDGGEKGQ
ncbi:hypothetical protein HPB52_005802 [Rhipicephalus sanguineus]|uniref:CCHC-type domain-containing protein n=1 Tax=Rhipicephalus sanguineus TaxID=34632 RepID=A0A9D4T3V7_RHISA|nr:hypothetical protein HPB52_005802 [Rhipicephalus sanguineus]